MNSSDIPLLIGSSSFIGQALLRAGKFKDVSHRDPALPDLLATHDIIINCAYHPALRNQPYDPELDLDTWIAKSLQGTQKKLIILSSRTVYGAAPHPLREDMTLRPLTHYASNKARTEDSCRESLTDNLLVLRLSNIFGFEWPPKPGRISFISQALDSLKTRGEITFDIAPNSEKDFLPVEDAARIIMHLTTQDQTGTYNVAAGASLAMSDVAKAIILGFDSGRVDFQSDRIDSFYMDVSKLKATGAKLPDVSEILKEFEVIGRKLATTEGIQA
jgi:nucleoside-diphosphate-sugar epimerase